MSSSTDLNAHAGLVLWFDDLGSGNEEYRFLSNFYEGKPFTVPGWSWEALRKACRVMEDDRSGSLADDYRGLIEWKTGEHAFAAMKFWGSDYKHFRDIAESPDPSTAKALGRSRRHPLRPDWEIVKLDVMAALTRAKYAYGRPEADALEGTGDKMLVEGTWWGDEVWGVALDETGAPGRNWLGTLLMARRAELKMAYALGLDASSLALHFMNNTVQHNAAFAV